MELNKLESVGLLKAHYKGNRKIFEANKVHPFYREINSLIKKHIGVDKIVDEVIEKMGALQSVYLGGKLAMGIDSKVMDLIFVGDLDVKYLAELINKVEGMIDKKVRYIVCSPKEDEAILAELISDNALLIWGETD